MALEGQVEQLSRRRESDKSLRELPAYQAGESMFGVTWLAAEMAAFAPVTSIEMFQFHLQLWPNSFRRLCVELVSTEADSVLRCKRHSDPTERAHRYPRVMRSEGAHRVQRIPGRTGVT